jgi:hypothetical protein
MEVTLNEAEQRLAKWVAAQRHRNGRRTNRVNARIGPQSDEETDLEGVAAEIAYCKLFNVYPDLETTRPKDPAADCVTRYGVRVDVKSTKYIDGKLLAVRWKQPVGVDAFALMIGEFPTYEYVGSMTARELLNDKRLMKVGASVGYAAPQCDLSWMDP